MTDPALLPCPFCGSSHVSKYHTYDGKDWNVECNDCFCRASYENSEAEAIAAWNRRSHQSAEPATGWYLSQAWSARQRADGSLEPGCTISGTGISYERISARAGGLEMQRFWLEHFGRIKPGESFFYIDAPFILEAAAPLPPPSGTGERT